MHCIEATKLTIWFYKTKFKSKKLQPLNFDDNVAAHKYDVIVLGLCLMIDHIHMLVSIPPKYSVSEFMGYLKGKSSLMIFDKFANMKYRYGNRQFWCRGYYVDTVGRNKKAIEEYIRNQLKEDKEYEQLTMKELFDPFTGEPVTRNKK